MMESLLISSSLPDGPVRMQAMQPQQTVAHNDNSARNTNLLADVVSRASNVLEGGFAQVTQYATSLGHKADIRPQELLLLQHRLAVHSAQLSIIKHTGEEISRGINSIVNR